MYCLEVQQTQQPQTSKDFVQTFETRRIDGDTYVLMHTLIKGKVTKYSFNYYKDGVLIYTKEQSANQYQTLDNLINQLNYGN